MVVKVNFDVYILLKNERDMKIVVLLAAYNGSSYLKSQINSLLEQKISSIKIYISLDLSNDDSLDLCQSYAIKNSNVALLPYGKRFGGAAKNFFCLFKSVDFSDYDYIALADQDDIWHLDKLSNAVKIIKEKNIDAYSSNVMAFWPDGREQFIDKAQSQREFDYLFEAAGPGCTYVLTRDLATKIKELLFHNPKANDFILHDWLIYAYARSHGYSWYIDPIPHMDYRQHHNNQVGVNNSFKSFLVRFKYVLLGGGLLQIKSLLCLLSDANPQFKKWAPFGRIEIFNMLFKVNQFRRKPIERVYVFITLFIALIMGVKDK